MLVPEEVVPETAPQSSVDIPEIPLLHTGNTLPPEANEQSPRRAWLREVLGKATSHALKNTLGPQLVADLKATHAASINPEQPSYEFSRRSFLRVAGSLALATQAYETTRLVSETLTAVDRYENKLWPKNKPTFNYLDGVPLRNPRAVALLWPGFGDMHAREEAQAVKEKGQVPKGVAVAYMDYSNQGASIDELTEVLEEGIDFTEEVELTFVCRSLGGPISLGVGKEIGKRIKDTQVRVKNVVFIASPYEVADGDYGSAGVLVAKAPSNRLLTTEAKASISFWRAATKHKRTNPFRDFGRSFIDIFRPSKDIVDTARDFKQGIDDLDASSNKAISDTFSGASPEAARTELRDWDSLDLPMHPSDISREEIEAYRKVFVPGYTKVLYTATEHPSTDSTVMVRRSMEHWHHFFVDILGFPEEDFEIQGIPYDGHANTEITMAHVRPWIASNVKSPLPTKILAEGSTK